jgi:hypothetical protein
VPIRKLAPPRRHAGDPPGPFAAGRPLRVFIDLPADLRQIENGPWEGHTAPVPEQLLWSLCQSEEVELYWLAAPDEEGLGAVRLQDPDPSHDQWPFVCTKPEGEWVGAIWPYRQLIQSAARHPRTPLESLAKAALAQELRVDVAVTDDPALLPSTGFYSRHGDAMTPSDALATVGLYLRNNDPTLVGWAPRFTFTFGTHMLAWSAVRAQLPSGWTWGSALVDHSTTVDDDYAMLLFGSFYERLVRMLTQRDRIHRATLAPADNKTGLAATEALDTMMFNIVGAFDAAAIAAHMGAGRPAEDRRKAGWQWKEWRRDLGVPHLYEMFHGMKPAEDLLTVCRRLRNTVHGAGLTSMVSSTPTGKNTLVRLPQAEAPDIVDRLNRLADPDAWGVEARGHVGVYIDPARLAEGLTPRVFATLEEVLAHTPLDHLAGTSIHREGPPTDGPFDLATRTRACLLYGLTPPNE